MAILPEIQQRPEGWTRLYDRQNDMALYVPPEPSQRPWLTVNDARNFDRRSFRAKRRNRATFTFGCPAGFWKQGRCAIGTIVQAVQYAAGYTNELVREFFSGRLQAKHLRDKKRLEAVKRTPSERGRG